MVEKSLINKRYQLGTIIGSGGMAVVYRARDLMLEREVALKVLREDYTHLPGFRERFHQEAKSVAKLSHPNIVTVHDFGLDNKRLFIIMEYVPGTDLDSLIQNRGLFTEEESIRLMIQLCAGVGYAHRAGLVHCDIKPHNILITPDKRVKVTDFGIARALSSIKAEEQSVVVWGSPRYFSPEQAAGLAPSPASDVYSLGMVFYEMLTGHIPFPAKSQNELIHLHRQGQPLPPKQFNPSISDETQQVILKVLSKEPTSRYRTADQMGRVLISISERAKTARSIKKPVSYNKGTPRIQPLAPPKVVPVPTSVDLDIDWVSVLLALIAMIAVGSLIPFWLWVYFTVNNPN